MKKGKLLSTVFALILFAFNAKAGHLKDNLLVSAKLDGAQEVPAVSTNALGVASFMINATRDTICVNITVTGLSGPITGIHVHEGDPGVNGGVVIDLTPFVAGNRIVATLTGSAVSKTNISKLLSGKFYLNVHTSAHPGGEIRGQLYLETDWSFSAILDGSQEVPPVSTMAYGVGVFNLSKDLSKIKFNVITQGLSGAITAAHLHFGTSGTVGGVAVDLSSFINGNVISGTIAAPSQSVIDSMMASKIYLNVHTAANPGGEIRAQLLNNKKYLYFDASLDGTQEVPPVMTNASGSATLMLNTTFDTLWYDVAANNLSGPITGAHFHNAAVGNNGGVVFDMSPDIMGNRITGKITGASLTTSLVNKFLRGEIYINLHTSANPNGEIRGQVYRLAREGYTFSMDGMQEVPPVTTSASGSGLVSIDRDQDNAHFMIVGNGLTPTAAHFHKGVMGQVGGVLFDLTPFWMNNGAFGYWQSTNATPFTLANSIQFRNDSVYVNVHTMANPNGEIRGQVMRGFTCYNVTIGIEDNLSSPFYMLNIYPNPATEILNINIDDAGNQTFKVSITDVLGKQVYFAEFNSNQGSINQSISTANLVSGLYFVKVQSGDKQTVRKFIKK
ncbi:MAG: CHRD domain-containing protein [Thermaurantimonas sp.]